MLRTNLSTRPFYNEGAVTLAIVALAVAAAILTAFNVTRVIELSRNDTRFATQASTNEARASELRSGALRLRKSVDPKQLDLVSEQARLANDLIDRRTFSWTELFNRFETTLPADVRITSVRPKFDAKGNHVVVTVVARTVDDVSRFMEQLEATGAFTNVLSREERVGDNGLLEATLDSEYRPEAVREAAHK
ncbi:MAG: PilN domain-containing protein [Betaproteobacteria bacterium]